MAKPRKGVVPPHLRKYLFKRKKNRKRKTSAPKRSKRRHHHHKGHAMAKKRKGRRKHHGGRRRRHHGGGGGLTGALTGDAPVILAGAVYGFVESKAKADATFFLNSVPKPVSGLGYAGNVALALYLLGYFTKNRYVKLGARGTATVAAYQLARNGKLFAAGTDIPTLSGPGDDDDEMLLGDEDLGALADEDIGATGFDDMVESAAAHT